MSFAITLFSNAPPSPGFENTVAHFKVRLAEKIVFDKIYEVALEYISFPKTWYNVFEESIFCIAQTKEYMVFDKIVLPRGYYESSEEVVKKINSLFSEHLANDVGRKFTKLPQLFWTQLTKTCTLNDVKGMYGKRTMPLHLKMSERLNALIGYVPSIVLPTDVLKVDAADINAGFRTLLAYSNIADYSFVGHSRSQLLDLIDIPTTAAFGEQLTHRITSPRYVPVLGNEIEEIEIVLKTDFGETIPFRSGRSALRLLLRPKNE